jgi:hypothetical protein
MASPKQIVFHKQEGERFIFLMDTSWVRDYRWDCSTVYPHEEFLENLCGNDWYYGGNRWLVKSGSRYDLGEEVDRGIVVVGEDNAMMFKLSKYVQ